MQDTLSEDLTAQPGKNMRPRLLLESDPAPVEWVNSDSRAPILLLCEHAGQAVPGTLNGLGLPDGAIDLHIGWDIGAEKLARGVAAELGAPLLLQRYSRLVIDCNRPPGAPSSIPEISDDMPVPGNLGLEPAEQRQREQMIFAPLDAAIREAFAQEPRRAAFSIHSFTRRMNRGARRKWDAGFLSRVDEPTAKTLLANVAREAPELELAINEPYRIEDDGDWFIPHHAEARRVRHCLIEVCNDQLTTVQDVARWSLLLARAIGALPEL